ncbi:putative DNA replication protein [Streptococcus infantarius subsp. infantarius]|nr:putative DNA replication protein [Streptococcus infantarius subsp. infantarius]
MFSKKITDSDKFLDLPLSTQALYFHLNMHADDDGFVDSTKTIKRMIGASDGDLRILMEQAFILPFESGVIVIKDWRVHNYIPKDRYQKTIYTTEFNRLVLEENKSYTECIQNVYNMDTQIRLDKNSIDKNSIDKNSIDENSIDENRLDECSEKLPPTAPAPKKLDFGQFVKAEGLKVNDRHMTRLLEYIGLDGMDMELVKEAVKRTTDSGIDNPNYTFKILDSWKAKGITTVEQANEEKENFQSQKQRRSYPNQQQPSKSNVPEWVDEEYKHEATVDEQAQLEALKKSMLED